MTKKMVTRTWLTPNQYQSKRKIRKRRAVGERDGHICYICSRDNRLILFENDHMDCLLCDMCYEMAQELKGIDSVSRKEDLRLAMIRYHRLKATGEV